MSDHQYASATIHDLPTTNPEFLPALHKFLAKAQELVTAGRTTVDRIECSPGGKTFLRVVVKGACSGSAYCFIALVDGSNRKLGSFKAGEVFKPDGYKGPARLARGSIFTPEKYGITAYGAAYAYR